MAQSNIADLMSLFSDLVDFWRSAHEALLERRRKKIDAEANAGTEEPDGATEAAG